MAAKKVDEGRGESVNEAKLRVIQGRRSDEGLEEASILEALQRGDPKVIEEVLCDLVPRVRNWLCRLLGPGADLDDAVQDALTEIARALPNFEGRAKISTLAYRITVRVSYRYIGGRQRRRQSALELVPPPIDQIDPESRAMGREALRSLYRCLDRLPKKRRVAFILCAVEGMGPSEAAEVVGTTSTAMRSRLKHARKELSRLLKGDPYVSALMGKGEA